MTLLRGVEGRKARLDKDDQDNSTRQNKKQMAKLDFEEQSNLFLFAGMVTRHSRR